MSGDASLEVTPWVFYCRKKIYFDVKFPYQYLFRSVLRFSKWVFFHIRNFDDRRRPLCFFSKESSLLRMQSYIFSRKNKLITVISLISDDFSF
jgi:hypothetical protein